MTASHKLSHLLQLADQGPALRAALAEEVAELLTGWPADYPDSMRGVCEALLAKAARDLDAPTRARLRVRLCSDPELAHRVLPRESAARSLVTEARCGRAVADLLAEKLAVDAATARQIVDDETGNALAVACKGAGLDRAAFSALAVMAAPSRAPAQSFAVLDAFDSVPAAEASRVLRTWREGQASAA